MKMPDEPRESADRREAQADAREAQADEREMTQMVREVEQDRREQELDARDLERQSDAHLDVLSDRERDVRALINDGLSNEDIAKRLYLSANTVKTYVRSAYSKAGATSRTQALRWY